MRWVWGVTSACSVIATIAILLWWYRYGTLVSPDGRAYLAMAEGRPTPAPFRWRLLPRIAGLWPRAWFLASWQALLASAVLVGVYAEQRGIPGWAATSLLCALPWFRGLVRMPLLTDQLAMAFALGATLSPPWLAVPLAMLAGACSERAPVFAAIFAWSPWPLVGLVVPLAMALVTRGPSADHNDWWTMRAIHNRAQPHIYALPWGAGLAAVMAPSWQLAAAVGLGYAQLLVATDRARLYQWGAPVVVVAALSALPPWSWPIAILATVISPASDWEAPWK